MSNIHGIYLRLLQIALTAEKYLNFIISKYIILDVSARESHFQRDLCTKSAGCEDELIQMVSYQLSLQAKVIKI
jgi:hypothetical protein